MKSQTLGRWRADTHNVNSNGVSFMNIGTIDRLLRVIVGLVLIALVFVGPQTPWGWIGVVPLVTGAFRFCPAYRLLGLNTCAIKS